MKPQESRKEFQSALPRGERREEKKETVVTMTISIRAPARGATTLAKRYRISAKFQSALPRGERLPCLLCLPTADMISIRAPARGATSRRWRQQSSRQNFNPRSREGSDNNFHQKVLFSLSKNCLIHLFFITNFLN